MANSIDDLTAKITDYAYDTAKLAEDKSIISLVKDLENLTKEITDFGFSAEISQQILPRVNAQREALENLYNQLQSVSDSVSKQLTSIGEVFDNIPYGKLKKMGFDTRVKKANTVSNPVPADDNGAEYQSPVMAPQGEISSGAPAQSAMLQNESTFWNNLKADMGIRSTPIAGGSTWNKIMENGDFKNMDLGLLNHVDESAQGSSFLDSITKALPKGAGDINNRQSNYNEFDDIFTESMKEGDFDAYEEFGIEDGAGEDLGNIEYTESSVGSGVKYDNVPEGTPMNEALYTSEQSQVAPIQFSLSSFGNSAAADIDFSNMELDESNDDAFSIVPEEYVEKTTHMKESGSPVQVKHSFASEDEIMSKIVG